MGLTIDFSHVHRPTTGLERVSLDLFSTPALPGIDLIHIRAGSNAGLIWAQWAKLPWRALTRSRDIFLCPGFPPSLLLMLLAGKRVIPYIHDMFLSLRKRDLNATAKYYMRPSFTFAVRHGRHFLVNSLYTQSELRRHCRADATIRLLRPPVKDVFGLADAAPIPASAEEPLRLVTIGTLEPRKNLSYGVRLCQELATLLKRPVELHIIGRKGWDEETGWISQQKNIFLHGYLPGAEARRIIRQADIFLSTSLEEGLGLPLLEVQHGGACVVASDIPVYREVLGETGCLIPLGNLSAAAQKIADLVSGQGWKERHHKAARDNVAAWNRQAAQDKTDFLAWIAPLCPTRGA